MLLEDLGDENDAQKFADTVPIHTNANAALAAEIINSLQTPHVRVDDRQIVHLGAASPSSISATPTDSSIDVGFCNSQKATESFLVHRPMTELSRQIYDQLGLDHEAGGHIKVAPPFCQTNIEGVIAAGDCASMMKIIPNAISMGAYAGAGIARELPKRNIRRQDRGCTKTELSEAKV